MIWVLDRSDPDQDENFVRPDLGQNCYQQTTLASKQLIWYHIITTAWKDKNK